MRELIAFQLSEVERLKRLQEMLKTIESQVKSGESSGRVPSSLERRTREEIETAEAIQETQMRIQLKLRKEEQRSALVPFRTHPESRVAQSAYDSEDESSDEELKIKTVKPKSKKAYDSEDEEDEDSDDYTPRPRTNPMGITGGMDANQMILCMQADVCSCWKYPVVQRQETLS